MEQTERNLQTGSMKSAFSRTALGLGALYEIYQGVASVLLGAAAGVTAVTLLLSNPDLLDGGVSLDAIIEMLLDSGAMGWILLVYALGMVIGMVIGLVVMRLIRGKAEPVEKRNLSLGQFGFIVLVSFGVWGAAAVLGNLPAFFGVEESLGIDSLLEGLQYEQIPVLLYTCIGAPLFEELACRKLLLDRLHPYGDGFAVLASGLLFGLMHGNSAQFFLAFALGILFALVYLKTGRIVYTILLHAIINTTASLPEIFLFWGADIDLVWNIVVGCLVVIGLVMLIVGRKNPLFALSPCTVQDARRAAWKNVGMILVRIFGLLTVGYVDGMMIVYSMLGGYGAASLLRLPLTALTVVTVLLVPRFTKRFEPAPAEPLPEV